jgi:glycine cleavage system H protein
MATKRGEKKGRDTGSFTLPADYHAWSVLPCNGLDKEAGALAREMALAIAGKGARLICPVRFGRSPSHYDKELKGTDLLVIDGCKKECAGRLATEGGLSIAGRLNVKEMLREQGLKSGKFPTPDAVNLQALLSRLGRPDAMAGVAVPEAGRAEARAAAPEPAAGRFAAEMGFREFMADKFVFKVPETGYFFNENDCWARVEGNRARLGVSDYVQQKASDMVFFEPPEVGTEIGQFDEAGSLESTKTALDIISPVSGKVVAVNRELVDAPELINEDPYVRGWAVEVELSDIETDRELLMDCDGYLAYLQGKVERELREKERGEGAQATDAQGSRRPREPARPGETGRPYEVEEPREPGRPWKPGQPKEPGQPWEG